METSNSRRASAFVTQRACSSIALFLALRLTPPPPVRTDAGPDPRPWAHPPIPRPRRRLRPSVPPPGPPPRPVRCSTSAASSCTASSATLILASNLSTGVVLSHSGSSRLAMSLWTARFILPVNRSRRRASATVFRFTPSRAAALRCPSPLDQPLHDPLEVGPVVVGPRCPSVTHFHPLQGWPAFAISSLFRWNQPFTQSVHWFPPVSSKCGAYP